MKKILIYNIFIFIILFCLLEISVRVFNLSNLLGIDSNLIVKNSDPISYKPNIESTIFGKKVYTDKFGYRVPYKNYKYSGGKSFLILGDSTSYGVGVKEERTFIGALRKKFPNINFYNSSLPGHGLKDHIKIVSSIPQDLKIKKIWYFLNLNDIDYLFNSAIQNLEKEKKYKNKINLIQKLKTNNFLLELNYFLRSKSALYVYIKSILIDPSKIHFFRTYNNYIDSDNFEKYEKKLDEFLSKKIEGLDLTVFILPWEFQTREICKNKDLFLPQDLLIGYLKKKEIDFIDFSSYFCDKDNFEKMYLKFDPAHLSSEGHDLMEKLLINNNLL